MTETTQKFRDSVRYKCTSGRQVNLYNGEAYGLVMDADRLAKLEDGIRALVDEIEPDDSVPHWVFRRIDALLDD